MHMSKLMIEKRRKNNQIYAYISSLLGCRY